MLKNDRGTILYLRAFKRGVAIPFIVDVFSNKISGIIFNGNGLKDAFKEGTLSGLQENQKSDSVAFIKESGLVIEAPADIRNNNIDKIEFTVVYPDGTTKIGERSAENGLGTLVWDDNIISRLNKMNPEYYWTGNDKINPAVLVIRDGKVVDRQCGHSTTDGCGATT